MRVPAAGVKGEAYIQDGHREHPWGLLGDPHLAVLVLTLAPQGCCFHPGRPHTSSELITGQPIQPRLPGAIVVSKWKS